MAVNRNIAAFGAGTGRLSTDQKKKLLWGNKKSNPSEEVSIQSMGGGGYLFIQFIQFVIDKLSSVFIGDTTDK